MSISGTRSRPVRVRALTLALLLSLVAGLAGATTVVPTTDASLFERADVVVHGRVLSSTVIQDLDGSPVTLTEIEPIEVFKGGLPENLILRQAGGTLPDGTFLKLWGRPEYVPGREAIVFAIARPEGDFQTAEMLLGKFDIARDALGRRFAVAPLSEGEREGVTVRTDLRGRTVRSRAAKQLDSLDAPRELAGFSDYLRNGARGLQRNAFTPRGALVPVEQTDRPADRAGVGESQQRSLALQQQRHGLGD